MANSPMDIERHMPGAVIVNLEDIEPSTHTVTNLSPILCQHSIQL